MVGAEDVAAGLLFPRPAMTHARQFARPTRRAEGRDSPRAAPVGSPKGARRATPRNRHETSPGARKEHGRAEDRSRAEASRRTEKGRGLEGRALYSPCSAARTRTRTYWTKTSSAADYTTADSKNDQDGQLVRVPLGCLHYAAPPPLNATVSIGAFRNSSNETTTIVVPLTASTTLPADRSGRRPWARRLQEANERSVAACPHEDAVDSGHPPPVPGPAPPRFLSSTFFRPDENRWRAPVVWFV